MSVYFRGHFVQNITGKQLIEKHLRESDQFGN